MAALFAPVPAYVLWVHFKDYAGSHAILLVPAALACLAGFLDRSRDPRGITVWMAGATYGAIVLDSLHAATTGDLEWLMLPPVILFAVLWVGLIVGVPAFICAGLGAWLRVIRLHSER